MTNASRTPLELDRQSYAGQIGGKESILLGLPKGQTESALMRIHDMVKDEVKE